MSISALVGNFGSPAAQAVPVSATGAESLDAEARQRLLDAQRAKLLSLVNTIHPAKQGFLYVVRAKKLNDSDSTNRAWLASRPQSINAA